MLIDFRVENFRSFSDSQELSLVASGPKDTSHPESLIACDGFKLVKVAGIYGANASGKSNLIRAIGSMQEFVRSSATTMNLGDPIPGTVPFRLRRDLRSQPSSFEVTIHAQSTRFHYGYSATSQCVYAEWLDAAAHGGRTTRWLDRHYRPESKEYDWGFAGPLKAHGKLLRERTRENGLALSRGAELNIAPLRDLYLWFREGLWVLDLSLPTMMITPRTARRLRDNEALRARAVQMIRDADFGIEDISIAERTVRIEDIPDAMRRMFSEEYLRALSGEGGIFGRPLSISLLHRTDAPGQFEEFDLQADESNGTQRFFALLGPFLDALEMGATLVVDELECSMHPLLTRSLVKLFQSRNVNSKGAQLVFATHDSTLMDSRLLRRDQTWLLEKTRGGNSELFSLYDIDERPRSTEAFSRNYLAGRYGGVPDLGPVFEDTEFE